MRKNIIIYHRVDYDGVMSGIIAKQYYESKGIRSDYYGWNYGDPFPEVSGYQQIIMVDVSFPPPEMLTLKETGKLVWIDHHQTAISDSEANGYSDVPGVRKIGVAAVELTFGFLYPRLTAPMLIQYVGAHDVWDKERFDWEEEVIPLQYGLKNEYGISIKELEKGWEDICNDCDWLIDIGSYIYRWIKKTSEAWVKNCAFPVTVAGKYKGIGLITPIGGSISFDSVLDEYDLYVVIQIRDQGTKYSISLYKENNRLPEFSVGQYLKDNYGGGGHSGAAGASITREQFEKIIYDHVL